MPGPVDVFGLRACCAQRGNSVFLSAVRYCAAVVPPHDDTSYSVVTVRPGEQDIRAARPRNAVRAAPFPTTRSCLPRALRKTSRGSLGISSLSAPRAPTRDPSDGRRDQRAVRRLAVFHRLRQTWSWARYLWHGRGHRWRGISLADPSGPSCRESGTRCRSGAGQNHWVVSWPTSTLHRPRRSNSNVRHVDSSRGSSAVASGMVSQAPQVAALPSLRTRNEGTV